MDNSAISLEVILSRHGFAEELIPAPASAHPICQRVEAPPVADDDLIALSSARADGFQCSLQLYDRHLKLPVFGPEPRAEQKRGRFGQCDPTCVGTGFAQQLPDKRRLSAAWTACKYNYSVTKIVARHQQLFRRCQI
jgi:hypothetical protein